MNRATAIAVIFATVITQQRASAEQAALPEPNVEIATQWWPELTNVYTPIGWKNHLFRFNVLFDGTLLAWPDPPGGINELARWKDMGVQLLMTPCKRGHHPYAWRTGSSLVTTDEARHWGYQGWTDDEAPVLWTEWRQSRHGLHGAVMRQEVFAHMPGAVDIETGTEPLFAWVRMSIKAMNPLIKREICEFLVDVAKPHIGFTMYTGQNALLHGDKSEYPRVLRFEIDDDGVSYLIEPDDTVRLAVIPGPGAVVKQHERTDESKNMLLHARIPAKLDAYVDLLVPIISQPRDVVAKEVELGRSAALAECNAYWSKRPDTAAVIETPEPLVNSFLRRNIQFGEIIAQKMPDSGYYTNLTGSLIYSRMWATPTSMFDTMLLDTLGYHDEVDRYLEIFRATQGTCKPPGPSYSKHPGYLATPLSLTSYDWLSDHGAIMHAVCYHALVSNNAEFMERWLEPLLKACEFIRDVRRITDHDGVPGVIPPGVATDRNIPTQAVWNVGWHYKGLISAVQLLRRINHPSADEYAREAEEYRAAFLKAFREDAAQSPTWTDAEGNVHPVVPTSLSPGADTAHPFYLDTGPLSLVYLGLMDATDPLMESALKFFREGPNHELYDPHGHHGQPPVLIHELSSCEPTWGWGFLHAHQTNDRYRFLEGMYSLLTGGSSRMTHVQCETRGGITGIAGHESIYLLRLSVVDDVIEDDALHLLRLVPKAWLSDTMTTRFEKIPTIFGPVSISFRVHDRGRELSLSYESDFHHAPGKVIVHAPPLEGLAKIVINGEAHSVKVGDLITLD